MENIKVFLVYQRLVSVKLPFVVEMLFNFTFQLDVKWPVVVKPMHNSKKPGERISVIQGLVELIYLAHHFDKVSHA